LIYFWIGLAVIMILVGLFLMTQGGAYLGQPLVMIGIVIGLILAICPARARIEISAAAMSATQAAPQIATMLRIRTDIS
jgi:hypothetical protein